MNKNFFSRCVLLVAATTAIACSSCQKEVLDAPASVNESKATLIFIRAVEKDSSTTNSEQIILR